MFLKTSSSPFEGQVKYNITWQLILSYEWPITNGEWGINIFLLEVQGSVHRKCIPKYDQQDATLHSFYFCKLLYMFRVDPPPIIRSTKLHLQHLVFVKPLLLPAAIVEELRRSLNSSTVAIGSVMVWQVPDAVDILVCASDDGWKYHPKHVEQFTEINKLCNVASCWLYFGTYFFVYMA